MTEYDIFKQREDTKKEKRMIELVKRGNKAYNKGLIGGLGFSKLYLYPLLRKPT